MDRKDENVVEIDLLQLVRALWRRVWIILLAAVFVGAAARIATILFVTPTYRASVLMYVNSSDISVGGAKVSISQGELSAAKSLVDTYTVILKTRITLSDVIEQSGTKYNYKELVNMISAASVNNTEVFKIDVVTPNPQEATKIANTIAVVLPEKISAIVEGSSARIVDTAVVPEKMDAPNYTKNTVLGAMIGFMLACGVIVVLELLDDKIRDLDTLQQICDIPVLAVIPDLLSSQTDEYNYYKKTNTR